MAWLLCPAGSAAVRRADAALVVDSDDREGTGGMNDLHPYSWPEKRLFAFQEQDLTRWADGVTVASRALESLAWGMGATRQQTLYLPNGPLLRPAGDRLQGRQRFGIAAGCTGAAAVYPFFRVQPATVVCRAGAALPAAAAGHGCWWWGRASNGEAQQLEQAADPFRISSQPGCCRVAGTGRWPIVWLLPMRRSTPLTIRC